MKDHLQRLVLDADQAHGWGIAREYLQARVLQILQRSGAMTSLAFHGGTALRFLYGLPRYSEDLDFALESPGGFDFEESIGRVARDLRSEGYDVAAKAKLDRVVASALVKFPGLPFELGLGPHREQVLAIKIEADTNPPDGAACETTIVRRHVLLNLFHHDPATLFAGKLHAILQRPHVKGRDVYDLVWYLADPDWPSPNLTFLHHALRQTGWEGPEVDDANWRSLVADRVRTYEWPKVVSDVRPFVEDPAELALLTEENVGSLLES